MAACVDQGSGSTGKKVDPKYVAEHLVTELPAAGLLRLDVSIGDKVVYVGNTLTRATDKPGDKAGDSLEVTAVAPGDMVRVTHFWRVIKPVGVGWRVFALLRGAPNTADFMNLPATDMQSAHGPALWKAGQLIADVVAVEPAVLLRLSKQDFDAVARKHPTLLAEVERLVVARETANRAVFHDASDLIL
jgi:hypothetical protein